MAPPPSDQKKKFACCNKDLTALLQGLRDKGVRINEMAMGELCIYSDWKNNRGDIIFGCKPVGRRNDEIWFECIYTDAFEQAMMTVEH